MLKALLFGFALIGAAVIAIAATAILAVLFLFTSPANAATSPVYLLESTEEPEEAINVEVEKKEVEPVFLLEVTEVPTESVVIIEEQVTKESSQEIVEKLKEMTIPQLKKLAKVRGVHVKSSLRKAQIIELLMSA